LPIIQFFKKINMRKKFVLVLSGAILMAACGNSGENKPADSTAAPAATSPAASAASDKGLELIGASDCTTCHRLHKAATEGASIGPAYDQVAAKYTPAADTTINRLVQKIITGGSGVWGTVPMTPHAALKQDDVKTMVTYILSLKS
jgi:cytochrome c